MSIEAAAITISPNEPAFTSITHAQTIPTTHLSTSTPTPVDTHPPVTWHDLDRAKDIDALGCLSTVLHPNGPWYDRHLLIPHEAIRYDMLLMERILQPQYFQPTRTWKVKRFFSWYHTYFLTPVHHHHEAEEKLYFPFILQKPGVVMPERLTDDHVTLLKQLDDIAAMQQKFAATMDSSQLEGLAAELRQRTSDVCNNMRDHLAEEERIVPPLLRDNFTETETLGVTGKIIGSRGLDNFYLVPNELICQRRAGGNESVEYLMSLMPGVMRTHYRKFSVTWYSVEQLAYINEIAVDSDTEPKVAKAHGCGLCRWYD